MAPRKTPTGDAAPNSAQSQSAVRRLQHISSTLNPATHKRAGEEKDLASKTQLTTTTLRIGSVSAQINLVPRWPEKVPVEVTVDLEKQDILESLQWMIKKDMLGQDIFLLGGPGPLRRHLALTFCALLQREHEYIVLHRDTSAESDLKQRREITRDERSSPSSDASSGLGGIRLKAEWCDAAAVTAAIEGRVLILEGVEKCELNVLPVLNNLLENREVNLEDGRHLVNPSFYDNLLQSGKTRAELDAWKLVRVSPDFRVIALGIPVPPYRGNPLDPPFRSRFQVRWVDGWGIGGSRLAQSLVVKAKWSVPGNADSVKNVMRDVVYLMETIRFSAKIDDPISASGSTSNLLPPFPQISLPTLLAITTMFPEECTFGYSSSLIERIFPYPGLSGGMNRDQTDAWIGYLTQFKMIPAVAAPPKAARRPSVAPTPPATAAQASPSDVVEPAGLESVRRMQAAAKNAKAAAEAAAVRKDFDHFVASMRRNARRSAYEVVHVRRADDMRLAARGGATVAGPKVVLTFRARNSGDRSTLPLEVLVPAGPAPALVPTSTADGFSSIARGGDGKLFVDMPRFRDAVTRMAQAHALGMDFCVVGPRGSGKSTALRRFAAMLGYDAGYTETVHCYKEMTARDLLQRRGTRRDGSTYWENSNLVTSAIEGKLCVLDGIEMLEGGTLASLQRLTQDREIPLPDGSWLTSLANFQAIQTKTGLTPHELITVRNVIPIHPSFRLVAMASTPLNPNSTGTLNENLPWLTEEVVNMFHFVVWGQMERLEEEEIVASVTRCPQGPMSQLFDFAQRLRFIGDDEGQGASLSKSAALSTRQLIRIGRRLTDHEDEDLYRAINRACLGPFLPLPAKQTLEGLLAEVNIKEKVLRKDIGKPYSSQNRLHIGDVSVPIYVIPPEDPEGSALVPRVPTTFFDNDLHTLVMREMAIDFNGGEHLLLIGNQGVGKNRLTDRFLELLNRPREYIQLHRDTTVQALMVQPTVENGVIFYKDSPLVRAVKTGRVLVVDEADKAPVYITSVLKSLAENGEMNLSDGRKIRPLSAAGTGAVRENDIIVHKDFRLILLANRPGYPFLGNDFYSQIGDVFATHAVDNPDEESELELLAQMAPEILKGRLRRLVGVFAELRQAFDDGLVSYPFSLRELINVVKHMRKFPDEALDSVLRNVFDFDVTRKEYHELLMRILDKHDVPKRELRIGPNALEGNKPLQEKPQLVLEYDGPEPAIELPDHEGVDDGDEEHKGGNQFQGGGGGTSSPGQGGKSGPHRLNKGGETVFQIAEQLKNQVSDEIRSAALDNARDGLMKRLQEINMSGQEAAQYKDLYDSVRNEVQQLRVVLEGVEAKQRERVWLKNQTEGELDDRKLIDGLTGEHAIYKRRGEEKPEYGAPQKKPKRLKFVFDLSGSMYRFNGVDGRLSRSLETAVMIMEALQTLGHKYKYDISGHSGDSDNIPLVDAERPPQNEMDRLKVVRAMLSHAQFTGSGDNTLPATKQAIQDISQEDADDWVVIVLSDANLRRYGIAPKDFGKVLTSDSKVTCVALFIGTLEDEAQRLSAELPPGRAFIAMQGSDIPRIIREIFASTIAASS
ncbi:hypothetical protein M427DRAFT_65996 [Gonapodya prolifera JEL478]|uniref:von Willebrand factor A domain-containing protein 8 n=1 Tax=Gonapodya prolifera (strain JEL478) TaxID=1344416 RepID=A0A139AXD0_GONPJ|nr:hypothetical protein M427DRAFT_65996 [Gonapodya prolifera JEL478]|eukprot:KXS21233.1 hypothetical protein M427DRAFT_65996 [Gonapodya prolifera JEL478]